MTVSPRAWGGWRQVVAPGGGAALGTPSMRGWGADGLSSLAVRSPLGVTVSFVSAAAADELDRLVNWRKSLGQQLENQREGSSLRPLDPLDSPPLAR